jgi:hypothetical protein
MIRIYLDHEFLSRASADLFVEQSEQAVRAKGRFSNEKGEYEQIENYNYWAFGSVI